jgi:hypothetical protein
VRRLTEEISRLHERDTQLSASLADRVASGGELTRRVETLDAQLTDATQQLSRAEAQAADRLVEAGALREQAETQAAEAGALREQLTRAEALVASLARDLSRSEAARAALQTLALLATFPQAAAARALAAANARLRALAATSAAARVRRSRPARIIATLRALGLTPGQLLRRPRSLGTLWRVVARPRLFKDAHRIVESGLFDAAYYMPVHRIAAASANPLVPSQWGVPRRPASAFFRRCSGTEPPSGCQTVVRHYLPALLAAAGRPIHLVVLSRLGPSLRATGAGIDRLTLS